MDTFSATEAKQERPPGKVLASFTFVLCAAAVFGWMNLWPGLGRIHLVLNFVACVAVALALLIVGVTWWYKTVTFLRSTQPWSLMIAVPPVIVVVGLVLALALPQPSFERSRPKFDAFVASLPATGQIGMNNQSIDSFDVHVHRDLDKTAVYFVDDDTVFFTNVAGWVYSPDHAPQQKPGDELSYTSLGGPWYKYSLVFDFD